MNDALQRRVEADILPTLAPLGPAGLAWIAFLGVVSAIGLGAYIYQLVYGLQVTAMREFVSWGLYMTNFVFFIGISHAGTLISAILRVTHAEWRRPITRMAEGITVFALMVGAPMVIIDMGRPDRIWHVLVYGRLNSPILWDVLSIFTYLCGSILYLYVAMIPDLATMAVRVPVGWRSRLYRRLSLGFRNSPAQRKALDRALGRMALVIIPVAVSVHTVVSWIFGMTLRPGWHSTIFGPYFVVGAIFSGTAAILLAMAVFRRVYHLESYLTQRQFANLGRLLLALSLLYVYFTLSEYVTTWYASTTADQRLVDLLLGSGAYATVFWGWVALGLIVPIALLLFPTKRSIAPTVIASALILAGMFVKRYLIVVPTLMTPFIPAETDGTQVHYWPTLVEWTVTAGGFAFFLLLFTLFAKVFPIISIWETVEGVEELGSEQTGVDLVLPHQPRAVPT